MRLAALLLVVLSSVSVRADAAKPTFDDDVVPVLRQHCQGCHNNDKQRGGLNLATFGALKLGGSSGEVVTAGDPDKSRLYTMTAHKEEPVMPPSGTKIPDAQVELMRKWIELGAVENKGSKVALSTKPKVDLSLKTIARGKPDGAPPMPSGLSREPSHRSRRAGSVVALAASPWAPVVAVGGHKQVALVHADSGANLGVLPYEHGQINSLKFSRSGKFLLAAGGRGGLSGRAVLYEVETGKIVAEVGSAETDAILAADLSPDQSTIAVGTTSRLVRVYQVSGGAVLHTVKKHTDWVTAVEYSPDGVLLATGDRNGGLFVWEAATAKEFYTLRGPTESVTDLSWRADSNLLATSSLDGTARLWEMQDGREVKKWAAHGGGTQSACFLPDGRLATTGRDRVTKLWDASGKQLRQFAALPDIGLRVAASHDNGKVVAGSYSGAVQIWASADGKPVATADANPAPLAEQIKRAEAEVATCQAGVDRARSAFAATEAAAEAQFATLARLEAETRRLTSDQQANAKLVADGGALAAKLVADEPLLKSLADKCGADAIAAGAKAEARRAAASAYALAATQLQAAAAQSPANAELRILAADAAKLAGTHAADAGAAEAAKPVAESARKDAEAKRQTATKQLGDARAALAAAQKKAGELAAAHAASTAATPSAKSARDAAQKSRAVAKVALDDAAARLTIAQARLAQLRVTTVVRK